MQGQASSAMTSGRPPPGPTARGRHQPLGQVKSPWRYTGALSSLLPRLKMVLALAAAVACGDDPVEVVEVLEPLTLTVSPSEVTLRSLGSGAELTARASPRGQVAVGPVMTWTSSNPAVVSIPQYGHSSSFDDQGHWSHNRVQAEGEGNAVVTVAYLHVRATALVTVMPGAAEIRVSPAEATLRALGDTVRLRATAVDANGNAVSGASFEWSSSDESVADVDGRGLVRARGRGAATVTASHTGLRASATVTVTQEAREIRVTPSSGTLRASGDTLRLRAEAYDANGNAVPGASFEWMSSRESVAGVDGTGLVTARGRGTTTITAAHAGLRASATVTVTQEVREIRVTPLSGTLRAFGDTLRLRAEAYDTNGSPVAGAVFEWMSSSESVAVVDGDGLVTARGNGSTTITAVHGSLRASASIRVVQEAARVRISPSLVTLRAVGDRLAAECGGGGRERQPGGGRRVRMVVQQRCGGSGGRRRSGDGAGSRNRVDHGDARDVVGYGHRNGGRGIGACGGALDAGVSSAASPWRHDTPAGGGAGRKRKAGTGCGVCVVVQQRIGGGGRRGRTGDGAGSGDHADHGDARQLACDRDGDSDAGIGAGGSAGDPAVSSAASPWRHDTPAGGGAGRKRKAGTGCGVCVVVQQRIGGGGRRGRAGDGAGSGNSADHGDARQLACDRDGDGDAGSGAGACHAPVCGAACSRRHGTPACAGAGREPQPGRWSSVRMVVEQRVGGGGRRQRTGDGAWPGDGGDHGDAREPAGDRDRHGDSGGDHGACSAYVHSTPITGGHRPSAGRGTRWERACRSRDALLLVVEQGSGGDRGQQRPGYSGRERKRGRHGRDWQPPSEGHGHGFSGGRAGASDAPSVALQARGDTVRLRAEAVDANGHEVANAVFTWTSANEAVAIVDAAGLVTARGRGSARITAQHGSLRASAVVAVAQEATAVRVTPTEATLRAVGETVRLRAEALDRNGQAVSEAVFAWTSDNARVASVDATGLVTAAGPGSATVTAAHGNLRASAVVTVSQEARSVRVTPTDATLRALGETVRLEAEVLDGNGHAIANAAIAWTSDNERIAEVDATGLVTAVGPGAATMTATHGNLRANAVVMVSQEAGSVRVSPNTATLRALGEKVRLGAEVLDGNGHAIANAAIAWTSDNERIAEVDATGLVTAVGPGSATVTAAHGNLRASAVVTVTQETTEVRIAPTEATLTALGDTVRLRAEALDRNGRPVTGAIFAWISDDESVVRVDAAGLVTAVGNGSTTVTAAYGNLRASSVVTVAQEATVVRVTPPSATLSALGDEVRLAAEALDRNGRLVSGATFSWASEDPSIVTVAETGLVTAVGNGSTTVTAAYGSLRASSVVTVAQEATVVRGDSASATMEVEETVRLTAEALDANGHAVANAVFIWSSNDASVARVDGAGLVTAISEGASTVTALLVGTELTGNAAITVSAMGQREILIEFYNATGGPNWSRQANWLTDAPLGSWEGVTTGSGGRVTSLVLFNNGLSGSIPPELGGLADLRELSLWRNHLSGSIPSELGQLANLRQLHLSQNDLDSIPSALGNLANLEELCSARPI